MILDNGECDVVAARATRDALQEAVDDVLEALKLAALMGRGFSTPTGSARPPIARIELHDEWITCRTLREVLNHVLDGRVDRDGHRHVFLFHLERLAKVRASQWAASARTASSASAFRDWQAALLRRALHASSTCDNDALNGDAGLFFQSVARLRAAHNARRELRVVDCRAEWESACALGSRLWSAPASAEPVADSRTHVVDVISGDAPPCTATASKAFEQPQLDTPCLVLELGAVLNARRRSGSYSPG